MECQDATFLEKIKIKCKRRDTFLVIQEWEFS